MAEAIGAIDKEIAESVKADETAKRLMTVPGVGPVTASAIMATIQDASVFANGQSTPSPARTDLGPLSWHRKIGAAASPRSSPMGKAFDYKVISK